MHKVCRNLGIIRNRVEHLLILRHEVVMRWSIMMPINHVMGALMIALKEAEINAEAISVHMHQGHIETQQLKDNN